MKKLTLLGSALMMTAGLMGCPEDPPPPPPEPEEKPEEVIIPPYNPTGDHADLKKEAAAGINKDNAEAKATEIEGALDSAIADLEKAEAEAEK
jgi:hypothetical protein